MAIVSTVTQVPHSDSLNNFNLLYTNISPMSLRGPLPLFRVWAGTQTRRVCLTLWLLAMCLTLLWLTYFYFLLLVD